MDFTQPVAFHPPARITTICHPERRLAVSLRAAVEGPATLPASPRPLDPFSPSQPRASPRTAFSTKSRAEGPAISQPWVQAPGGPRRLKARHKISPCYRQPDSTTPTPKNPVKPPNPLEDSQTPHEHWRFFRKMVCAFISLNLLFLNQREEQALLRSRAHPRRRASSR